MENVVPLDTRWSRQAFSEPDERLLERVVRGEREGLEQLYYRHGRSLLQYLVQLCPDRHVAEEILQDALAAVWQCAHRFSGKSAVRTWLLGIARRPRRTIPSAAPSSPSLPNPS